MTFDERAFLTFARDSAHGLRGLAIVMCGDHHHAEDLVQRALEKVFIRWNRLEDPLAYARQIVVNASRDGWRHRSRHPESIGLDAVREPSYEDGTSRLAERDHLLTLISTLPQGQRAAVVLRHWLDLSEIDAAKLLGVSVGTIKSQTSRGLSRLQELLSEDPPLAKTRRDA